MKNKIKKISFLLAALFLLACVPMTAMAEKNTKAKIATPSDMEEDFEVEDGEESDLIDSEDEEEDLVVNEDDGTEDAVSDPEEELLPEEMKAAPAEKETAVEDSAVRAALPKTGATLTAKDLAGIWTIDGITSYRFNADGTGALVLPEHKYPFDFTLEGDEITLKFDSSKIRDVVFTVKPEGGTLILTREEAGGTAEFTLKKTGE